MSIRWLLSSVALLVTTACADSFLAANPTAVESREYAGSSVLHVDNALRSNCQLEAPSALFESDQSTISRGGAAALRAVAVCVTTGPLKGYSLAIHGHADPRGTESYNDRLAARRAESVIAVLAREGVPVTHLKVISHGEDDAKGKGKYGYAFDRRVQIELLERSEVSDDSN